jgi:hypothetical protein
VRFLLRRRRYGEERLRGRKFFFPSVGIRGGRPISCDMTIPLESF